MAKVTAIVLAAGLSSRMLGEQKLFLPYRNKTILENVVDAIVASKINEIIVVSSPLTHDRIAAMSLSGITLCSNPDHREGMTTTIQRGIEAASADNDGFMICLGDMPRIIATEYDRLISEFSGALDTDPQTILLPLHQGQKGNPVIFSSSYRDNILAHQEMEGCKAIVQANADHLVKVAMEKDHVLVDVDTKEAYELLTLDIN